jgi:hypothetical protein
MLHLDEKGGREILVRHDLEKMICEYLLAAGFSDVPKDTPIFQRAVGKTDKFSGKANSRQ